MLNQEALRLPIREPNFFSFPAILHLFGLVILGFCLFLWQNFENYPGRRETGDTYAHTLKST